MCEAALFEEALDGGPWPLGKVPMRGGTTMAWLCLRLRPNLDSKKRQREENT